MFIIDTSDIFDREAYVDDVMDCVFSPDDVDKLPQTAAMVTNAESATINAHEIAIITGTEAARTGLFAKMIAATMLSGGSYPFAEGMKTHLYDAKVLWVDAVTSVHDIVQLARDMKQHFNADGNHFKIVALTALGADQTLYKTVRDLIYKTIDSFLPNLIIINDLDNIFPTMTWTAASGFVEFLRDYVNNKEAAVCAVGHNLIGKVKKTTGYLGDIMFPIASTVYRISERSKKESAISRVSCYKTFRQCPRDFAFTINDLNFPQQVLPEPDTQNC